MTEIHANNSGSDISSDSWTLLDDNLLKDEQNSVGPSENSDDIIEVESEGRADRKDNADEPKKRRSDGFLTFDEYLQERLLEHDYEQEEKPQKLRRMYKNKIKRGFRKCKAQSLGISVFITIMLALTAFATLCSTLSQPVAEKEVEVVHFDNPVKTKNATKYEQVLQQINDTIKDLEEINITKLMQPLKPTSNGTTLEDDPKVAAKPVALPKSLNPPPVAKERLTKYPKCDAVTSNILKAPKTKPKPTKTKWMILKELLLDTNLHALVSLIMTNIYLFTLLADFAKKPSQKNCPTKYELQQQLLEDLEKNNNIEEIRKYLFKELPFWNAEFASKDSKKKKLMKKCNDTIDKPPKRTNTVAVFQDNKKVINSLLLRTCPFLSEHALGPVLARPHIDDSGKSECQRRFEELDQHQKKFENLKQAQRNRIKLLKQKFRNEVSFIRDTEEESEARAEKINRTSQMFIRKLKFNREKYLFELKKVRELRQKVSDARKKETTKDAATGSYSVSLPPIYDYGEKFKMIKEKFERENHQLPKEFKFH
jgi:hypothetical protein